MLEIIYTSIIKIIITNDYKNKVYSDMIMLI